MKTTPPSQPPTDAFAPQGSGYFFAPMMQEQPPQNDADESIDVRRYVELLRKRWWVVVLGVAIGVSMAALYTMRQPSLYRAQSTLLIDTATPRVLTGVTDVVDMGTGGWWASDAFYQREYRIMQSRAVARRAGEKLGIISDDKRTGLDQIADVAEREKKREELDPADFIMGTYSVEPEKSQNIVYVVVVDQNAQRAADIANAVSEAYLEHNVERRATGTEEAGTWLAVQHQELKQKLESSENALYKFMEDNQVLNASLQSQIDEVLERLRSFNSKLADVQAEKIRTQLDSQVLADVKETPALIDSIPEVRNAPVISALKTKRIELDGEKTELAGRYQDAHPKMVALNEQITIVDQNLQKEIDAILLSLVRVQDKLTSTEAGLTIAIADERAKEARLNKLKLDYDRLKREVDTNAQLYDMVTTRMKEADLTGNLKLNHASILDPALPPGARFKPILRNNLIAGFLLALALSLALIIGLDLLDNTVKTQEDIERFLSVPFLGLLPLIEGAKVNPSDKAGLLKATQERDLYVLHNPKSSPAECARFIRTNLLFMSPDKPLRTLVVTSAGPQEGKTTTACSLAVTMAQSGSRTLIIDTDMRKPRLHRAFGVSNDVGLSSVIVGEKKIEEAIQATDQPGLDVMVCGPIPPNPSELLHTTRFKEIVEHLKTKYERILFDSPPVGAVTDPVILGTQADGTVMVLKCQKTTKDAAKASLRALKDANVHLFGAVLNDVDLDSKRYGGYYYQYYRKYGSYYGESDAPTPGAPA
jgi:succinoglycan biosynthesis transport protein ExoP